MIVSAVNLVKRSCVEPKTIDGRRVDRITAFLFHDGGNHDPHRLAKSPAVASKGVVPYGMGFVFEDNNTECTSLDVLGHIVRRTQSTLWNE